MENKTCCSVQRDKVYLVENGRNQNINIKKSNRVKQTDHLIELKGGEFLMGTNDPEGFSVDGEGPVRSVSVQSFAIDQYAVTNSMFTEFINETGYITDAERFRWSYVFHTLVSDQAKILGVPKEASWWFAVKDASWKNPEGGNSTVVTRLNHPVVHVSWNDAMAYCKWSKKRLLTETEWEYAARGGLVQKKYPWGNELMPNNKHRCNIWQGEFPLHNTAEDGFISTAPVDTYEPNAYGLYNMAGNVWEWCSDWYSSVHSSSRMNENPIRTEKKEVKVLKGGSYLCHKTYCNRYRVSARIKNTMDSSSGNIGFRCGISR